VFDVAPEIFEYVPPELVELCHWYVVVVGAALVVEAVKTVPT
jgi:hypothetical protein